jgi:hypothetical protein
LKITNQISIEKPDPKKHFRRDLTGKTDRTAIKNTFNRIPIAIFPADFDCGFSIKPWLRIFHRVHDRV